MTAKPARGSLPWRPHADEAGLSEAIRPSALGRSIKQSPGDVGRRAQNGQAMRAQNAGRFLFFLKDCCRRLDQDAGRCDTGRNESPDQTLMEETAMFDTAVHSFDARGVAKRFRHAAIFGALEALSDGETMRFVNDHDPLPLLDQIQQRYGRQVGIAYVAREPGNIVIDFSVQVSEAAAGTAAAGTAAGSCGGGNGCGCSGG
ncbi:DUF2249 domain-containing protein [Parazoarcus communis]|nr:DUF2249 domain-containing protein [Parazoarcus communis]